MTPDEKNKIEARIAELVAQIRIIEMSSVAVELRVASIERKEKELKSLRAKLEKE